MSAERSPESPRRLRRHVPAVLVTLAIAALLLVTNEGIATILTSVGGDALVPFAEGLLSGPAQQGGDKPVHAILFFVHTAALAHSLAPRVLTAGALSFVYGGVLELLQLLVGRHGDLRDLAANGVGVSLCVAWQWLRRRRRRSPPPSEPPTSTRP